MSSLLTFQNAKTPKSEALGVLTGILYLAPYDLSGHNVCAMSTPDCRRDCLYTAGRGVYSNVQEARLRKARQFFSDRKGFMKGLREDIERLTRKAERDGMKPAVRLNGTSDILWERIGMSGGRLGAASNQLGARNIMQEFPHVQFYDYTKHSPFKRAKLPPNYHVSFSVQQHTLDMARHALAAGWTIDAVCDSEDEKRKLLLDGFPFVDGDEHDARFLDGKRAIALLKPKGTLRKRDTSTSRLIMPSDTLAELAKAARLCDAFAA